MENTFKCLANHDNFISLSGIGPRCNIHLKAYFITNIEDVNKFQSIFLLSMKLLGPVLVRFG